MTRVVRFMLAVTLLILLVVAGSAQAQTTGAEPEVLVLDAASIGADSYRIAELGNDVTIEFEVAPLWDDSDELDYAPAVFGVLGFDDQYSIHIAQDRKSVGVDDGEEFRSVAFDFADGKFHHVALVASRGTTQVFVDGKSRGSIDVAFPGEVPTSLFLGSSDGYNDLFLGAVLSLRVWQQALDGDHLAGIPLATNGAVELGELRPAAYVEFGDELAFFTEGGADPRVASRGSSNQQRSSSQRKQQEQQQQQVGLQNPVKSNGPPSNATLASDSSSSLSGSLLRPPPSESAAQSASDSSSMPARRPPPPQTSSPSLGDADSSGQPGPGRRRRQASIQGLAQAAAAPAPPRAQKVSLKNWLSGKLLPQKPPKLRRESNSVAVYDGPVVLKPFTASGPGVPYLGETESINGVLRLKPGNKKGQLGEWIGGGTNSQVYKSRQKGRVIKVVTLGEDGDEATEDKARTILDQMAGRRMLKDVKSANKQIPFRVTKQHGTELVTVVHQGKIYKFAKTIEENIESETYDIDDGKKSKDRVTNADERMKARSNNKLNVEEERTVAIVVRELNKNGIVWSDHKPANFDIVRNKKSSTGYEVVFFDFDSFRPVVGADRDTRYQKAREIQKIYDQNGGPDSIRDGLQQLKQQNPQRDADLWDYTALGDVEIPPLSTSGANAGREAYKIFSDMPDDQLDKLPKLNLEQIQQLSRAQNKVTDFGDTQLKEEIEKLLPASQ